jgi:hypothetical protein
MTCEPGRNPVPVKVTEYANPVLIDDGVTEVRTGATFSRVTVAEP